MVTARLIISGLFDKTKKARSAPFLKVIGAVVLARHDASTEGLTLFVSTSYAGRIRERTL